MASALALEEVSNA